MGSEFDGLMEYEKQKMTCEELGRHDLERMKLNAFKVWDKLTE